VNVLVDTPVWSLALRRKPGGLNEGEEALMRALAELIREGRVEMMGVVRQELLSGIREKERFRKLRDSLRAFEEAVLGTQDYEEAARMHNACRARGVAGSASTFWSVPWRTAATGRSLPPTRVLRDISAC